MFPILNLSQQVAKELLRIKAINLRPDNPFTWSSGWRSPIYCDNRLTLSYPEVRTLIKNGLVQLVRENFSDVEAIAGVATAGIPQAALVADELKLPMVYVRPKPKDHGMENMIEGSLEMGKKIVVVEDLISTGGSSLKAAEALRNEGLEVLGMVAIFTYGFSKSKELFAKFPIQVYTLTDYEELIQICSSHSVFDANTLNSLTQWRDAPETWSPSNLKS